MATILITGGSRGIGKALAERYVARGDVVISTYRATEAGAAGARLLQADVADPDSLERAAASLDGTAIDLLVCNAGFNDGRGRLDSPSNTAEVWATLFVTNVTGVFFTARAFAANVIKAQGKIVVISSRMGSSTAAAGTNYAYRASKAAASNIAANLAVEMKGHRVAVASYHPGWVKTDMGGQGVDLDVTTSAVSLMKQFDSLSLEGTGAFVNYDGEPIAY